MDEIDQLAQKHGFEWDASYRAFLAEHPQGGLPDWGDVEPMDPTPPGLDDIPGVFGVAKLIERIDVGDSNGGDIRFWHQSLLKHLYVIGKSYSGDPILQVASGAQQGAIVFSNHESWYGGFDALAGAEPDEEFLEVLDRSDVSGLTTDEIVAAILNEETEGGWLLAPSFRAFYAALRAVAS